MIEFEDIAAFILLVFGWAGLTFIMLGAGG